MKKIIYNFKSNLTKKIANPKNILGGKGANLSEMGKLGFAVPPGFTISTEACELFYNNKKKFNLRLKSQIKRELKIIEKETKKKFWANKKTFTCFGEIRRQSFDAWNDGYHFKPWTQ